jgi:hypothetical protein
MNTASRREDIPKNYHLKSFFQLVCVERKIEICEEKKENDVKFLRTVQSSTTGGNSLSLWMSHGST